MTTKQINLLIFLNILVGIHGTTNAALLTEKISPEEKALEDRKETLQRNNADHQSSQNFINIIHNLIKLSDNIPGNNKPCKQHDKGNTTGENDYGDFGKAVENAFCLLP